MELGFYPASGMSGKSGQYQPIDQPMDTSDSSVVLPERRKRTLIIAGWIAFAMVILFITLSASSGTHSNQSDAEFLRSSHKDSSDSKGGSHGHHKKTSMPTPQPTHAPTPWTNWVPEPYRPAAVPGEPSLPPTNSPPFANFVPAPYQPVESKDIAAGSPPWAVFIPEPFNPFLSTPSAVPTTAPTPVRTHKPTAVPTSHKPTDEPHHGKHEHETGNEGKEEDSKKDDKKKDDKKKDDKKKDDKEEDGKKKDDKKKDDKEEDGEEKEHKGKH